MRDWSIIKKSYEGGVLFVEREKGEERRTNGKGERRVTVKS